MSSCAEKIAPAVVAGLLTGCGSVPSDGPAKAGLTRTTGPAVASPDAGEEAPATGRIEGAVTRLDGRSLSPEQVEATVQRLMTTGRVTGLALAILNQGEIVYLRGFGFRNVEQNTPLTENTIMYAASLTKAMFA